MNEIRHRNVPLRPTSRDDADVVARFFRTLGEPERLRLLALLLDEEHTVADCVVTLGISRERVSTHLRCLVHCGFVQTADEHQSGRYRVADPDVVRLVELAHTLVADNAAATDSGL